MKPEILEIDRALVRAMNPQQRELNRPPDMWPPWALRDAELAAKHRTGAGAGLVAEEPTPEHPINHTHMVYSVACSGRAPRRGAFITQPSSVRGSELIGVLCSVGCAVRVANHVEFEFWMKLMNRRKAPFGLWVVHDVLEPTQDAHDTRRRIARGHF